MAHANANITVLGAGISGLATAFWLTAEGFDVTVLEAAEAPGGSMQTVDDDGFLIDYGPNSGLETTPLIGRLVEAVGLADDLVYANPEANRRYILRDDALHALPTGPGAFLRTRLFSGRAKLRLLAEPFVGRSSDGYYQSISQFVTRRLGREFLDYAINPFVAGVFAGNPDKLSVKSAFPKLYRLEEVYGGLFKGVILGARERKKSTEQSKQSARMFSFKNGMQSLPRAIAAHLGERVVCGCRVTRVTAGADGFTLACEQDGQTLERTSDVVLSTVPAFRAAEIFEDPRGELAAHLQAIYYPPVKVLFLGFERAAVERPLDGFGFLIPAKENKAFLGAIWSSVIFPARASSAHAAFTLFVGGARSPELLDSDDDRLKAAVIEEFKSVMGIEAPPVFVRERLWPRAIPQYNIGHIEHERFFETFEAEHPGLFLSGNYRGGISVGDCIKNSEITSERIKAFISGRRA